MGLQLRHCIAYFLKVLPLCVLVGFVSYAKFVSEKEREFFHGLEDVRVQVIGGQPSISQESIRFAYASYGLLDTRADKTVSINIDLEARGITKHNSYGGDAEVSLGSEAFESWQVLASTLAHEVEVHVNQNPFIIWIEDLLFETGTIRAERAAYNHEIRFASRFGLHAFNQDAIQETRDHFYPLFDHSSYRPNGLTKVLDFFQAFTARAMPFSENPSQ